MSGFQNPATLLRVGLAAASPAGAQGEEMEAAKSVLRNQYVVLLRIFDFYASLGAGDPFTMREFFFFLPSPLHPASALFAGF